MEKQNVLTLIKAISMLIMFLLVEIIGKIPLRSSAFQENQLLLSITGAFSGGLFISVALLHLIPEANFLFQQDWIERGNQNVHEYPYASLICVLSFGTVLLLEKNLFQEQPQMKTKYKHHCTYIQFYDQGQLDNNESNDQQQPSQNESEQNEVSNIAAYILSFAIGIHQIFEGIAIGIERNLGKCLGLALAIVCHKWAEGLTLGLAFRKSNQIDLGFRMITMQAIMNPIGIIVGWLLSNQGELVSGIFQSISAGTFLYVATMEVINQEFSNNSYKHIKIIMFFLAIGLISSLWQIERLTQ